MDDDSPGRSGFRLFLLLLLAVMAGVLLYSLAISHGQARHGMDAPVVRQCLDRNGPLQIWHNPSSGNWANMCRVGKLYGLQILDADDFEITAFIKDKMTRLEQVERYLINRGYIRVQ